MVWKKLYAYYKKEGSIFTLLKKVENEYTKDNRYHKEIPGLSFRTNYWRECDVMEIASYVTCNLSQYSTGQDIHVSVTR